MGGFSWWVASERAIYNLMVLVAEAVYVPEGVKLLKASTNRVECVIVIVRCKADVQAVAPAALDAVVEAGLLWFCVSEEVRFHQNGHLIVNDRIVVFTRNRLNAHVKRKTRAASLLIGAYDHGFGGSPQDLGNKKKIGQQRAEMAGGVQVID